MRIERDTRGVLAFILLLVVTYLLSQQEAFPQTRPNPQKIGDSNNNAYWYAAGIYGGNAGIKIQAALDSVSANGGRVVAPFVGAQTISDTIVISKDKTHITLGGATFTLSENTFISITGSDVTFDGAGATLFSNASSVTPVISVTGDRVTVKNVSLRAPVTANGITAVGADDLHVEGVVIDRGNYGIFFVNTNRTVIEGCRIDSTYRTSIWGDTLNNYSTVKGNHISKPGTINSGAHAAIKFTGSGQRSDRGVRILDNTVDSAMVLGIGINSTGGAYLTTDVLVQGNVVRGTGIGSPGDSEEGISFSISEGRIVDNYVEDSGTNGILAFGQCENTVISGNTIVNNRANHGIQVVADGDVSSRYGTGAIKSIVVTDNVCRTTSALGTTVNISQTNGGAYSRQFPVIVSGNSWNGTNFGAVSFANDSLRQMTINIGNSPEVLNGVGTISSSGTAVTGSGTYFLNGSPAQFPLFKGQWLRVGTDFAQISSITNDSVLTLVAAFATNKSSESFQYVDDQKTVRIYGRENATPLVVESNQNASGAATTLIRANQNGTAAQNPRITLGSNNTVGPTWGTESSFFDMVFDHNYSLARNGIFKLRGTEIFRYDTNSVDLDTNIALSVGGVTFTKSQIDTLVDLDTGGRTVTFTSGFSDAAYAITATCRLSDGTPVPFFITSKTASGFTVVPGSDDALFEYEAKANNQ